jgi:hypothetical protein
VRKLFEEPSYLAQFFLEREMFETKVIKKHDTNFLCAKRHSENRAVYEKKYKKCGRTELTTDDNIAHALCVLDS